MADDRTYEKVRRPLSADELLAILAELARLNQTEAAIDASKKTSNAEYNALLKSTRRNIATLAELAAQGYELVDVETLVVMDSPKPGMKRTIRVDNSEVLREESMTFSERQIKLFEDRPDMT